VAYLHVPPTWGFAKAGTVPWQFVTWEPPFGTIKRSPMVHQAYTRQQLQYLKKFILKRKKWLCRPIKDLLKIISTESFMIFLLYFLLFLKFCETRRICGLVRHYNCLLRFSWLLCMFNSTVLSLGLGSQIRSCSLYLLLILTSDIHITSKTLILTPVSSLHASITWHPLVIGLTILYYRIGTASQEKH